METIEIRRNKKEVGAYEEFDWVLKAKEKEESRYGIHKVRIEQSEIVCTDGKRLHKANVEHLFPIGTYDVITHNKDLILLSLSDDQQYPDYKVVLPNDIGEMVSIEGGIFSAYAKVIRAQSEDQTLDYKYLCDCLTPDKKNGISGNWKFKPTPNGGPIVFVNCTRYALIMPYRA